MAMDEMPPPPRQPRGAPDLEGAARSSPPRDSGGSMNQQGNNQGGKTEINWMFVAVILFILYNLFGQGNLAANTWQTNQVAGKMQAQGEILGGLTAAMQGFGTTLAQVTQNQAALSQNQLQMGQQLRTLEGTVNQQGQVLSTIGGNVSSMLQVQQQTNALLLSLGNGSAPQNANIAGTMFDGKVPTQLGGMTLPGNGVAGAFPGAMPQAGNSLYGEPNVTLVMPGSQPQTTIDANGQMHVVDPFGRIGVQPGGQP